MIKCYGTCWGTELSKQMTPSLWGLEKTQEGKGYSNWLLEILETPSQALEVAKRRFEHHLRSNPLFTKKYLFVNPLSSIKKIHWNIPFVTLEFLLSDSKVTLENEQVNNIFHDWHDGLSWNHLHQKANTRHRPPVSVQRWFLLLIQYAAEPFVAICGQQINLGGDVAQRSVSLCARETSTS